MWKDIKGYEGYYQVSDKGQVRRFYKDRYPKLLKNRPSANYYTVSLSKNCEKKTFAVHRLVAEAFLEKPVTNEPLEVNHKDGNKLNNNVSNLEWVTQRENLLHAMKLNGHHLFGKAPRKVKCIDPLTNEVVTVYSSVSEAARNVTSNYARTSITQVCKGRQASAYGYKWEYAD